MAVILVVKLRCCVILRLKKTSIARAKYLIPVNHTTSDEIGNVFLGYNG